MPKSLKNRAALAGGKVFIVEDHPVFCEGLSQLINSEKDLKVCGAVGTADEALKEIARLKPDLVLVDLGLPGKSGLELIKEIRAVDRKVKLLVLSMHDEALYADRVLRAGGDGYIMKQENPEEIVHAIHDVLRGHIYVSDEVLAGRAIGAQQKSSKRKPGPLDQLTDSELEILELLGKGHSSQEIARKLRSNVEAVDAICAQIQRRLKLNSENALIRYAVCWVETGKA